MAIEERGIWEQRGGMASEAEVVQMGRPRISSSSEMSESRISCNRGHWRPAEDERLQQLVKQYGPQNWNFIAEHLDRRSGKSCRLRWYNQLDPNIIKKPFTDEEEEMLLALHKVKGNKWAAIARYFPGRTDNAVKNHFHVLMARRKRERFTLLNGERSFNNNINYYAIGDSISSSSSSSSNTNIINSGVFNLQNYRNMGAMFGMSMSSTSTITFITSEASASGGVLVSKPHKDSSAYCYSPTPPAASSMLGSYHSFTAPGVPSIGKVVPLPYNLSNSSYGHRTEDLLLMRTNTGKQHHHLSLQQKSVPFIDFLGVGTSSAKDKELSTAQPISDRQVQ